MGSDNSGRQKGRAYLSGGQRHCSWCFFAAVIALALLMIGCWLVVLPPPELLLQPTFERDDYGKLPKRCLETAKKFDHCQHDRTFSENTLVFCCHRKWCHSFGHCEFCHGLGDRTRNLLAQVQLLQQPCSGKIKIDAPMQGLATLSSAVYQDPAGWLGEIFHYRSYNVKEKVKLPFERLERQLQKENNRYESDAAAAVHFSHFTPDNFEMFDYNGCYFHILYQPTQELQAELERHNAAIGDSLSIGIHYRTGDVAAFGIPNKDNRLGSHIDVMDGWLTLLDCGKRLAKRIFPKDHMLSDVTFYLATDSAQVKHAALELRREQSDGPRIYVTDVIPASYLRGNVGDYDAWMEVLLLSQRQGLVANSLPNEYRGTANEAISTFALLAAKIGFISDEHIEACALE